MVGARSYWAGFVAIWGSGEERGKMIPVPQLRNLMGIRVLGKIGKQMCSDGRGVWPDLSSSILHCARPILHVASNPHTQ